MRAPVADFATRAFPTAAVPGPRDPVAANVSRDDGVAVVAHVDCIRCGRHDAADLTRPACLDANDFRPDSIATRQEASVFSRISS
jgi:hypothetical protein